MLDDPSDKVKAFEAGGVDYVRKPINFEEVRVRVRTHLRIAELQKKNEKTIEGLVEALSEVKQLKELLPICSSCKSIRDDDGYWSSVEHYFTDHGNTQFSHSFCPECVEKLYPSMKKD